MSELSELKRLGATPVKNSGRGQHHKGDGILERDHNLRFTIDVKEYGVGYSVTSSNWAKVNTDAKTNRTDPALFLVLGNDEPKTRLVVISEDMFLMLLEERENGS